MSKAEQKLSQNSGRERPLKNRSRKVANGNWDILLNVAENNNPNFLYSSNRESAHTYTHTHALMFFVCALLSRTHYLGCCSGSLRITINTHTFTFLLSSIYFLFQLLFGFPFLLFLLFLFVGMPLLSKETSERTESTDGFSKPFTLFSYCQERQEHRKKAEKNQTNNLNYSSCTHFETVSGH